MCVNNAKYWTCCGCEQEDIHGLIIVVCWATPQPYHLQCYIKQSNYLRYHIPSCTSEIKQFKWISSADKITLIKSLLPHYVSSPLRYQIKPIKYNFDDLTDPEIRKCLQQRDIKSYNNQNNIQFQNLREIYH